MWQSWWHWWGEWVNLIRFKRLQGCLCFYWFNGSFSYAIMFRISFTTVHTAEYEDWCEGKIAFTITPTFQFNQSWKFYYSSREISKKVDNAIHCIVFKQTIIFWWLVLHTVSFCFHSLVPSNIPTHNKNVRDNVSYNWSIIERMWYFEQIILTRV